MKNKYFKIKKGQQENFKFHENGYKFENSKVKKKKKGIQMRN